MYDYENQIKQVTKKDIKSISEMLQNCQISQNYTEEQILNNEDNVLSTIFENSDSTEYLIKNKFDKICNSEIAMEALGKSTVAYEKVMSSEEYFNKIVSSSYINKFEENAQKVPQLNSNNDKGYILEGIAVDTTGKYLYNAFDYSTSTSWLDTYYSDNIYGDGIITIEFPIPAKIYHMHYFIEGTWAGNYTPSKYQIYGINNDEESLIKKGDLGVQEKNVYFYNNVSYKKYKFVFEHGNQGSGASLIELYYR